MDTTKQPVQGLHHITVMASDPQRNIDFYAQVLGQRLVKTTVNFDDPGTYHLYYGDEVGTPGTIMTFFPWLHAMRGEVGNGETAAVAYGISADSLEYWQTRLREHEVEFDTTRRFNNDGLSFEDPDGLRLELIAQNNGQGDADVPQETIQFWPNSPVPQEHALHGFHSVTLWLAKRDATEDLLLNHLGFTKVGEEDDPEGKRTRYMGDSGGDSDGVGLFIDIVERPGKFPGRSGAGTVHHIALRTRNDTEQQAYLDYLREQGQHVTPVQDRQYFHSIYFREPGGVLFEIATDAPGFPDDEAVERLGSELKLPAWLEPHRAQIEAKLPEIRNPEYDKVTP